MTGLQGHDERLQDPRFTQGLGFRVNGTWFRVLGFRVVWFQFDV